ncbi:MAG TPA: HTTM domain-containing protein, partial [Terriglobia bacterium]|nr:HTTM domain-containing protein [Terriglobia bacterium]
MTIPGRKILRNMFGLDYRSLALLRIGLGTLILCNLYVSAGDLRAFYTDEGLLPRSLLLSNFGRVFSLHMAGGSMAFAITIFAVQAVLALLMIAGYRTRIVTIASYVLLVSLQARNPLLIFGADIALRICFFWAMFLPLNRRFSLDAAVGRVSLPETSTYFRIPGIAYLVQFAAIYLFSGLLKTGAAWKVDHTAVSYALSLEIWRRPLGAWLNQFDSLTTWLTRMTPSAEIYGPLLLILPVWSAWGRILGFALFAGLQIGFNACMQMGLFGPVMIVVSFALLPAEFWTYLVEPGGRRCARMLARFSNFVVWPKKFIDSVRNRMQQSRQVYGQLRSGRPAWPRLRL